MHNDYSMDIMNLTETVTNEDIKAVKDAIQGIKQYKKNILDEIEGEIDKLLDMDKNDLINEIKIIKRHIYEMDLIYLEYYSEYNDHNYDDYDNNINKVHSTQSVDNFHMGMNYFGFLSFVSNENWTQGCVFSDGHYDDITEHIVEEIDVRILCKWLFNSQNAFIDEFNRSKGKQFKLEWSKDKYNSDWTDDDNGYIRIAIFYGNNRDDFLAYVNGVKVKGYNNGKMNGSIRMYDEEYSWTASFENGMWEVDVINFIGKIVEERIVTICKLFDYDDYAIWNIVNILFIESSCNNSFSEATTISASDLLKSLKINKMLIKNWNNVIRKVCDLEYGNYLLFYSKNKDVFTATPKNHM